MGELKDVACVWPQSHAFFGDPLDHQGSGYHPHGLVPDHHDRLGGLDSLPEQTRTHPHQEAENRYSNPLLDQHWLVETLAMAKETE